VLLAALLISFAVSALAPFVARRLAPYGGWILSLLPAGLFAFFLGKGLGLSGTGSIVETVEWVPALGISLTLVLDGFSLLFALLVTGIGTLVTIYAGAYFAEAPPKEGARFLALILFFMSAMLGTVLADDLIVLYLFWESTSLLSFLLIGFHAERPAARKAALQSLLVTAGGGLCLFAGILLVGGALGTWSLAAVVARGDELVASPVALPAMILLLLGAFTKSAQFPFHFWLPAAMEAPTPASAFLHSATMVKLGVYLLARLDRAFDGMPLFGETLVFVGLLTMAVGAIRAVAAAGYKALLAQSTVASLGVLVMLIGVPGPLASTATIAFVLAHALYKAALFFCAGTVIHATHESDLPRLGGLGRRLPLTAAAACLAALSMAGLPPTLGFITKEYLFESQLDAGTAWLVVTLTVVVNAVFVAIAGIAALRPFFSKEVRSEVLHPESPGLVAGPLALGLLGLAFGLVPAVLLVLIEPATAALVGRSVDVSFSLWHGFTPMLVLSATVIALGIGLLFFWRTLHHRPELRKVEEMVLGDAGYQFVFDGILSLAGRTTRFLQNGDQRRYTATAVGAALVIVVAGVLASGTVPVFDPASGTFDLPSAIVLLVMCSGAVAATRAMSLMRTMLSVSAIGFGSAVLYLMNGAPDIAFTQFSVEVLVAVILVALLLQVPDRVERTRQPGEKRRDALLAASFGLVLFVALAATVTTPLDLRLSDFFGATSLLEAHGRNVVNVIIVDYRGFDTLGETVVVAFAAITVWGLLRRAGGSARGEETTR